MIHIHQNHEVERLLREFRIVNRPQHRPDVGDLPVAHVLRKKIEHLLLDILAVHNTRRPNPRRQPPCEITNPGPDIGDYRAFGNFQRVQSVIWMLFRLSFRPHQPVRTTWAHHLGNTAVSNRMYVLAVAQEDEKQRRNRESEFHSKPVYKEMQPTDSRLRRSPMTIRWQSMALIVCGIQVIHGALVPKFDVASIKLCSPSDNGPTVPGGRSGGGNYGTSPGRLHIHCMSVDALVKLAYTVNDPLINVNGLAYVRPVRGGPAWTHSDFYTIEAETDDAVANGPTETVSPAKKLMTGPMLQALLEDRFQLKTHRAAEEVPMYALTVAKSSLKLKPMEQGCTPPDFTKHLSLSDLALPKPPCNTNMGDRKGPNHVNDVVGTLRWFAQSLSSSMDRHVIDKTGVTELFRIHLEYLPDENTPQRFLNGAAAAEPASDIPPGPSIFTALEQIGLKLVPDKGPQEYLVIDQVERPSGN